MDRETDVLEIIDLLLEEKRAAAPVVDEDELSAPTSTPRELLPRRTTGLWTKLLPRYDRDTSMIELHPSITEFPDPNATLWRFMDFTKYVSMLHRRALFFSRADQLPDPFEGLFGSHGLRGRSLEALDDRRGIRERVLLSCWHQNEHESAAMWRIYLSSEDGVAVRSSVARLRAGLEATSEPVYLGQVRYLDSRVDRLPDGHELTSFFCKRKNYDYEREVRAVWWTDAALEGPGRYLPADLGGLIEEVVISPTAETWFEDLVRSVTEKYDFNLRVSASSMVDGLVRGASL